MGLNPMRKSGMESLPERQAAGIHWERAWGWDSSTNGGMDLSCNLDQSLGLSLLTFRMTGSGLMM